MKALARLAQALSGETRGLSDDGVVTFKSFAD
jgi:hypothetical protein